MTPRLEVSYLTMEPFNSDIVLSDFLHEMDQLDDLQTVPLEFVDTKRRQDLNSPMEPQLKKMKSTTSPEPSKPTSRKRRSTSWLRRKQELNALRSESEALETHLTFLQMELDRRKAYQQKPTIQDQGMWQSVAIIARQECQNSQNENARLKEKVQLYAQASKMLQDQLTVAETRRMQLLGSPFAFVRVGVTQTPMLCFENDEIFKMLERRINDRFHELDLILREAHRPTEGGTTTEQVQICREGGQDAAAAVEFRHVRLLPFGEDTMARSLWEIIELGGVVLKTNTRVIRNTSDMIEMVSCHGVPFGNNGSVSAKAHTIIKRFAVSTGMVALIEAHSEWSINYPSSEVSRSTTEEGGWVVVHEYPIKAYSSVGGAIQRASQLRTSVKLRPNEAGAGGNVNSLTTTMVDVVIPSFRDILSSHHQSVENFLLDSERTEN
ncbi:Hypothetical protein PHPALM_3969 [Phytophthora palmivora]|uniref:M96 mating-specific protein family n=1 Tax=Phytophthora palmivora TaxID=4796 RepID=A0A2P4YL12_9STRA|nr:Hypothetical protein PHPALM_3969 [Phytophthora palmivora]